MVLCCKRCWCSYRDPVAYLSIPFALAQILYVTYCMTFHLVIPVFGIGLKSAIILISFYIILMLLFWSYFASITTEPGIPNQTLLKRIDSEDSNSENYRRCERCQMIKPYRAHHCRRCQCCILKMDHHCPWVSNCVGARNQKYFMLFLLYVILGEGLSLVMTYFYIMHYSRLFKRYFHLIPMEYIFESLRKVPAVVKFLHRIHLHFPYFEPRINTQMFVCLHVIFSSIFFIFCIVLLFEQLRNIWYDRTYIEESWDAMNSQRKATFYDSLVESMGEPLCLNWFLPLPGKEIENVINRLSMAIVENDTEESDTEVDTDEGEGESKDPVQKKNDLSVC